MGKPIFSIGRIPPTPGLVDQFFNDSTGIGDRGEPDVRGPWNQGGEWQFVTRQSPRKCYRRRREREPRPMATALPMAVHGPAAVLASKQASRPAAATLRERNKAISAAVAVRLQMAGQHNESKERNLIRCHK